VCMCVCVCVCVCVCTCVYRIYHVLGPRVQHRTHDLEQILHAHACMCMHIHVCVCVCVCVCLHCLSSRCGAGPACADSCISILCASGCHPFSQQALWLSCALVCQWLSPTFTTGALTFMCTHRHTDTTTPSPTHARKKADTHIQNVHTNHKNTHTHTNTLVHTQKHTHLQHHSTTGV